MLPRNPGDGRTPFEAQLSGFADVCAHARLTQLSDRLGEPVAVAVQGRRGVGRGTIERALRQRGIRIVAGPAAEVRVLVVAEVCKPEDRAALAATELPTVIVVTKVDTSGADACFDVPASAVAVPVIGLLAAATGLDDELDAFGTAAAERALAEGASPTDVVALLHRLSNVDGLLDALRATSAPVRYRRVQRTLGELRAIAARTDDDRLWAWLASDAVVASVAAAARDVLDVPDRGAVEWSRYARSPLNALHRACAADVVRAALR